MARRLENNNIICNYQAAPEEEGFTASGALRLGVAEMTRFGMQSEDFGPLAQLMADIILRDADAKEKVAALRRRFLDMQYCFDDRQIHDLIEELHKLR
jgi:aminomethyltransferase